MSGDAVDIKLVDKCMPFVTSRAKYIVAKGGRGSGKTHSIGRSAIIRSMEKPTRFLCTRLFQGSIAESVHKLLTNLIYDHKLQDYFTITERSIKNVWGSEFIFKGLQNNINEIKSLEGVDICWVEEAQGVSKKSWEVLIPTIRSDDAQIWVSYNPDLEDDYTHDFFVNNTPDDCVLITVNHWDNPFFPETLRLEMEQMKRNNYEAYLNIWCGECKEISDAQVFKGKFRVADFETPEFYKLYQSRFFIGLDFGFAKDATACNRMFIQENTLYIDYEAHGHGIENDELEEFLVNSIPEIKKWQVYGDNSRPETISHLARRGFNITGAEKGKGSVEDGIAYLKGFDEIVIHTRCVKTAEEFKKYSYKVDKNTEEILPILVDKWNHHIDDIRYGISPYIKASVSILDHI